MHAQICKKKILKAWQGFMQKFAPVYVMKLHNINRIGEAWEWGIFLVSLYMCSLLWITWPGFYYLWLCVLSEVLYLPFWPWKVWISYLIPSLPPVHPNGVKEKMLSVAGTIPVKIKGRSKFGARAICSHHMISSQSEEWKAHMFVLANTMAYYTMSAVIMVVPLKKGGCLGLLCTTFSTFKTL